MNQQRRERRISESSVLGLKDNNKRVFRVSTQLNVTLKLKRMLKFGGGNIFR